MCKRQRAYKAGTPALDMEVWTFAGSWTARLTVYSEGQEYIFTALPYNSRDEAVAAVERLARACEETSGDLDGNETSTDPILEAKVDQVAKRIAFELKDTWHIDGDYNVESWWAAHDAEFHSQFRITARMVLRDLDKACLTKTG